ncbi:MAG TPA: hypothetical protein VK489_06845 [Ferruginibacter sp.]|nr:hypothetical protein [Ferruginibacter sp.]
MDLNTEFIRYFREQAEDVAKANLSFEKDHITGILIRNTLAGDKNKKGYPELWEAVEETGDTEYTIDTFIKAARIILAEDRL